MMIGCVVNMFGIFYEVIKENDFVRCYFVDLFISCYCNWEVRWLFFLYMNCV